MKHAQKRKQWNIFVALTSTYIIYFIYYLFIKNSNISRLSNKRKRAQNIAPTCWYFTSRRHTKDVCKSPTANIKWSDQWYLLYSEDKREIGTHCKDHIRLGKEAASVFFSLRTLLEFYWDTYVRFMRINIKVKILILSFVSASLKWCATAAVRKKTISRAQSHSTTTMTKLATKNDPHDVVSTKIIRIVISGCFHSYCCS